MTENKWVERIGIAGVIAGLIFVGVELELSRDIARAEAFRAVQLAWADQIASFWDDETSADIIQRGMHDLASLSREERGVFHGLIGKAMSVQIVVIQMHEDGLLPADYFPSTRTEVAAILNSPGGSTWWTEMKPYYGRYGDIIEESRALYPDASITDIDVMFSLEDGENYHREEIRQLGEMVDNWVSGMRDVIED